jgi:RNA polymerase sigma-70 factor, ECF subfamily
MVEVELTPPEDGIVEADLLNVFHDARDHLLRTFQAMLGNYEDARDALQIAFLRCWEARSDVPHLRNLRAWVWRVSLNAARDLRDRVRRRRMMPLAVVESHAASSSAPVMEIVARKEEDELLQEALEYLRPEEQEVFLLRQSRGLTYTEIARVRGSPVGTGKTLMRSALHKLQRMLGETEVGVN